MYESDYAAEAVRNTQYLPVVYLVYAAVAVGLTVWLARTLYSYGAVFLEDVFDRPEIAVAVNRLLVTGFFMLNLGWAMLMLRAGDVDDATGAIEALAAKLGTLLLVLGTVHFANLWVLRSMQRRRELRHLPPPVAPQQQVPVAR